MEQLSEHIRKLLREAMDKAYEKELSSELEKVQASFNRWRGGEISVFELSDEIHRFHQGPNRKLYVQYTEANPLLAVAAAVSAGILQLDELHPDLQLHIERSLQFFTRTEEG
jgi:hypothetical protein